MQDCTDSNAAQTPSAMRWISFEVHQCESQEVDHILFELLYK